MIHVATVHWHNERWIDIQLAYLARHAGEPYRVYAFLNGIDPSYDERFYYSSHEPIAEHAVKLNLLADIVAAGADEDDLLLFLDGDAFPISDVSAYARPLLATYPLLAVQRLENNGDVQPHPCFCVTTVGFWKRLGGDWKEGHTWTNRAGDTVTDVGGNLLGALDADGIAWHPILRSNAVDLHELWYGVYDGVVYHHGAGFRVPISRLDTHRTEGADSPVQRVLRRLGALVPFRPRALQAVADAVRRPQRRRLEAQVNRTLAQSEEVLAQIEADPDFHTRFTST